MHAHQHKCRVYTRTYFDACTYVCMCMYVCKCRGVFQHQKWCLGCLPQLMDEKRKWKRNQSVRFECLHSVAVVVVIVVSQLETEPHKQQRDRKQRLNACYCRCNNNNNNSFLIDCSPCLGSCLPLPVFQPSLHSYAKCIQSLHLLLRLVLHPFPLFISISISNSVSVLCCLTQKYFIYSALMTPMPALLDCRRSG